MHRILDEHVDLRSTEDIGCDVKDPRYIKRLYAFNAFTEESDGLTLITGNYNNVEQEHHLKGDDAFKQLIEICAH